MFWPSSRRTAITMPSADFLTLSLPSLTGLPLGFQPRPPRVRSISFAPYICRIYVNTVVEFWTLKSLAFLSGISASYPLPVRQTSVLLTASFRFRFTSDTLAVRLTLPFDGRVRFFQPLEMYHAWHTKKKAGLHRLLTLN